MTAGALEEGSMIYPDLGASQGDVYTPLQSSFFRTEIARAWIDPEHDAHLFMRHFHAPHEGMDHFPFARPVRLHQPVMHLGSKALQRRPTISRNSMCRAASSLRC